MGRTTKLDAVVLLSGGLDSLVTLALALKKCARVYPLAFRYGQAHAIELEKVREQLKFYSGASGLQTLTTVDVGLGVVAKSSLVGGSASSYVPGRNAVFLSIAASFAESLEVFEVWCGFVAGDPEQRLSAHSPDATPEFVSKFNSMLAASTKDVEVKVVAPLVHMSKHEVATLGVKLGAPLGLSWSCYSPALLLNGGAAACGRCPACVDRTFAAAKAGVPSLLGG